MAARHDLHISINQQGEVEIEVKGVDGPACVKLTREIEEELGIVSRREKTSEYFKQPTSDGLQITGTQGEIE